MLNAFATQDSLATVEFALGRLTESGIRCACLWLSVMTLTDPPSIMTGALIKSQGSDMLSLLSVYTRLSSR